DPHIGVNLCTGADLCTGVNLCTGTDLHTGADVNVTEQHSSHQSRSTTVGRQQRQHTVPDLVWYVVVVRILRTAISWRPCLDEHGGAVQTTGGPTVPFVLVVLSALKGRVRERPLSPITRGEEVFLCWHL